MHAVGGSLRSCETDALTEIWKAFEEKNLVSRGLIVTLTNDEVDVLGREAHALCVVAYALAFLHDREKSHEPSLLYVFAYLGIRS